MSTVGLELNNYINPGWTWKIVTKGYRSATRRTRKMVARNQTMGAGLADQSAKKVNDSLASDTEKLGVAILGGRFGDKVEQMPLKKRKVVFRSPSSPCNIDVTEQLGNLEHGSVQLSSVNSGCKRRCRALNGSISTNNNSIVNQEISEDNERMFVYSDDFSGIEILAAVACRDSMGVGDDSGEDTSSVEGLTGEQIEQSISKVSLEKTFTSSDIISTSLQDTVDNDIVDPLSFEDSLVPIVQKYHKAGDDISTKQPSPVRDDWLHLDLNVAVDASEQPCDVMRDDPQKNVLKSVSLDGDEKVQLAVVERWKEPEDTKHNLVDRVVSSDLTLHSELKGSDDDEKEMDGEGRETDLCFVLKGNTDQFATTPSVNVLKCSTESPSGQNMDMDMDKSCDIYVNNSNEGVYEGSLSASPSHLTVKKTTGSIGLNGEILCVDNLQPKPDGVVSCLIPDVESAWCKIDKNILNGDGEESGGRSGMHIDDTNDSQEMTAGRAEGAGGSLICESIHASNASADSITEINSSVHAKSEEPIHKSCGGSVAVVVEEFQVHGNAPSSGSGNISKVSKGDPSGELYDYDVSQDETVNIAGMENSKVLQAGYDSQFEDGELREEDLHYREENEGADGYLEHVDYGSEYEEDRFCGMEGVESNQKNVKVETGLSSATDKVIKHIEHCAKGDDSREKALSLDKRISDVSDGSKTEKYTDNCVNQRDAKDFHPSVTDFRACKRELLSRVEGSLSSDTFHRKDTVFFPRSRDACVDNFTGRDRCGRSPLRGNFLNSSGGYWESKHGQSPTYCGPYDSGHPRPRSIIESHGYRMISDDMISEEAEEAGSENCTRRRTWSASNVVYQPLIRRRPLAEREDAYDMGMVHKTDLGPRSRLRRYPQGIRRGIQEDYHKSILDNYSGYPNHMPRRFARRDRSFSPLSRGRTHYNYPCKNSRSRSRSHTPSSWFSSRERNDGVRHRSRSPISRFNCRVDRPRFPFQKHFAEDYEEGFMSPPRRRLLPKRDSRWFDDRNNSSDRFRGRKFPVRAFRQSHRFDSVHAARRLNSDENFRHAMRPRRFSDNPSSDDDGRKRSSRYEVNQVRQYKADGILRQHFQYNVEDSFMVYGSNDHDGSNGCEGSNDYNGCNKITERRPKDVVRRSGEE